MCRFGIPVVLANNSAQRLEGDRGSAEGGAAGVH